MMEFLCGLLVGIAIGGYLAWERYLRNPSIEVRVTPEVASQIVDKTIREWLDRNDMAVMPRGKEFRWPGEVRQ